jgi:hypothetical protein
MTLEELLIRVERGEMLAIGIDMGLADSLRVPLLAQVWVEPSPDDPRMVTLVLHAPEDDE